MANDSPIATTKQGSDIHKSIRAGSVSLSKICSHDPGSELRVRSSAYKYKYDGGTSGTLAMISAVEEEMILALKYSTFAAERKTSMRSWVKGIHVITEPQIFSQGRNWNLGWNALVIITIFKFGAWWNMFTNHEASGWSVLWSGSVPMHKRRSNGSSPVIRKRSPSATLKARD
ncbi:hypothetical protein C8R44DRAFT_733019 [Mycena epipterygia]|nr:hypothetical protein C8R44DRAFT_733019 [Mycena epipterygia]